jgi:hypothetical protein
MEKIKNCGKRIFKDMKEYSPAAVVFVLYYFVVHILLGRAFCPLLNTTGIPCAGCGLTRAFLFLLTGQIRRAVYINPMAFPILLFGLYCGYFRYIRGTEIKGFWVLLSLLLSAMLLFYAVRMYLYFPDRVPYVYNRDNLLAERLPGYREMAELLIQKIRTLRG